MSGWAASVPQFAAVTVGGKWVADRLHWSAQDAAAGQQAGLGRISQPICRPLRALYTSYTRQPLSCRSLMHTAQ